LTAGFALLQVSLRGGIGGDPDEYFSGAELGGYVRLSCRKKLYLDVGGNRAGGVDRLEQLPHCLGR
jgi:hypothetical protein